MEWENLYRDYIEYVTSHGEMPLFRSIETFMGFSVLYARKYKERGGREPKSNLLPLNEATKIDSLFIQLCKELELPV